MDDDDTLHYTVCLPLGSPPSALEALCAARGYETRIDRAALTGAARFISSVLAAPAAEA